MIAPLHLEPVLPPEERPFDQDPRAVRHDRGETERDERLRYGRPPSAVTHHRIEDREMPDVQAVGDSADRPQRARAENAINQPVRLQHREQNESNRDRDQRVSAPVQEIVICTHPN